jgi:hypothetical protein
LQPVSEANNQPRSIPFHLKKEDHASTELNEIGKAAAENIKQ